MRLNSENDRPLALDEGLFVVPDDFDAPDPEIEKLFEGSNLDCVANEVAQFGVVELRRYTLHPGRRDDLMELFERKLVDSHDASGMTAISHYTDLDDPDAFVWLRGFKDMESRRVALDFFYGRSPVWRNNRNAANDTMIDSDNVLLLRDARPGSGLQTRGLARPFVGSASGSPSFAGMAIFMLEARPNEAFVSSFERDLLPELREIASRVAYYATEESPNDYPRLPVREGVWAFVVVSLLPTRPALDAWKRAFDSRRMPAPIASAATSCEVLRLKAAARSLLR
jgi:hypothetical protein